MKIVIFFLLLSSVAYAQRSHVKTGLEGCLRLGDVIQCNDEIFRKTTKPKPKVENSDRGMSDDASWFSHGINFFQSGQGGQEQ